MSINMDAILAKAKNYVNGEGRERVKEIVNKAMLGTIKLESGNVHTPEEAATKFIEVMQNAISSSGLSANAQAAISSLAFTAPTKLPDGTYQIGVYFDGNMSRPSLDEARYGGITQLPELFNNGMTAQHSVHGIWHGKETWSRRVIPRTEFMEQAVNDFLGNYAAEYNVLSVRLDKSWE